LQGFFGQFDPCGDPAEHENDSSDGSKRLCIDTYEP